MEIWKPVTIVLYSEIYEVSNIGRVRNIESGKVLSNVLSSDKGYFYLKLSNKRTVKRLALHRLVAMAFIGLPNGDRNQINHKDGNGKNNRVENLEWSTHSENMYHKYRVLGWPPVRGAAKLTDDQVLEIRRLRSEEGLTYKSLMKRFGVCKTTISYIINRKTWYHI